MSGYLDNAKHDTMSGRKAHMNRREFARSLAAAVAAMVMAKVSGIVDRFRSKPTSRVLRYRYETSDIDYYIDPPALPGGWNYLEMENRPPSQVIRLYGGPVETDYTVSSLNDDIHLGFTRRLQSNA